MILSQTTLHQCVINLFSTYSSDKGPEKPSKTALFLALRIYNDAGLITCLVPKDEKWSECPRATWERCDQWLSDTNTEKEICSAFEDLHFYASDPLTKDDDPELVLELTNFIMKLACEDHTEKPQLVKEIVPILLTAMRDWRGQHVFHNNGPKTKSKAETKTNSSRSYISRWLSGTTKRGEVGPAPSRNTEDRRRSVRPMSSAPDFKRLSVAQSSAFEETEMRKKDSAQKKGQSDEDVTNGSGNGTRRSSTLMKWNWWG